MYKIIQTNEFEEKFKNIFIYLIHNFSLTVAQDYWNYLDSQIRNLQLFPNIGKTIVLQNGNICRAIISKKNIVLYQIDEEKKQIVLLGIVSSNENYLNLF